MIVSHVTGITQPILTFANHFHSFAMNFTFGWCLTLIATPGSAPCDTAEVLRFSKTAAEDTSMSVHQNSEAASAYRISIPLRPNDVEIACDCATGVICLIWICWMLEFMCASGAWFLAVKFSYHHPFHFKFSYNIYTPLYIPEKQVELHPSS